MLLFPYAQGASFMWTVWARVPPASRPSLTTLIPQSTEQVLQPVDRFLTPDAPTEITFTDLPPAPWRVVYENTFGALESRLFLQIRAQVLDGATGWDGDRYRVLADALAVIRLQVVCWRFRGHPDCASRALDVAHRASQLGRKVPDRRHRRSLIGASSMQGTIVVMRHDIIRQQDAPRVAAPSCL